ncbi:MAG: ABC transporter ATP-binding protein, partial [Clostridia bacterium]|nr:ABC transporter ATP-binding protein [Clostridia bacterium]
MKKLLVYLSSYKKETVLAPLFKFLEAIFDLLVPLVVKQIIDVGIANRDKPYIVAMCAILVGFAIVGLGCTLVAQYYAARAAVGFSTALRRDLFAHIQKFSYAQTDTVGTSTLITRMTSDINQLQAAVNLTLRLFLRSPVIVLGAMIMAFTVDVRSALVFVVVIPLLSAVVFTIM